MKEPQRSRTLRVDDKRWAKFRLLGGAEWLRRQIDKAKEPKPTTKE